LAEGIDVLGPQQRVADGTACSSDGEEFVEEVLGGILLRSILHLHQQHLSHQNEPKEEKSTSR